MNSINFLNKAGSLIKWGTSETLWILPRCTVFVCPSNPNVHSIKVLDYQWMGLFPVKVHYTPLKLVSITSVLFLAFGEILRVVSSPQIFWKCQLLIFCTSNSNKVIIMTNSKKYTEKNTVMQCNKIVSVSSASTISVFSVCKPGSEE